MTEIDLLKYPFPPLGFEKAESRLEGIEVYVPVEKSIEEQGGDQDFHCPQCGGVAAYNIQNEGLQCSYCGYLTQEKINQVVQQAAENEFSLKMLDIASRGWGLTRQELECSSCGARITFPEGSISNTCAFCQSNKVILQPAEQPVIRPGFILPFKIDQEHCIKHARDFLGNSWMVPNNLRNVSALRNFIPIYLSYWTFDAGLLAQWKAQVGHTQQESYYDSSDRSWKTRMKTVWRWEHGNLQLRCDDLLIPGTSKLSNLHLVQINNFDLRDLINYTPMVLAGFRAKAYDVNLEIAWDKARQEMRNTAKKTCIDQASTSQVRDFSMNLDFSDERWRSILIPVYIAAYSFGGRVYQVLINGQTGAVSGQRPVDWQKIWLVVSLLLAPGILLGLIGLVTIPIVGFGVLPGVIGIFLLLVGCVISIVIGINANRLDDA